MEVVVDCSGSDGGDDRGAVAVLADERVAYVRVSIFYWFK